MSASDYGAAAPESSLPKPVGLQDQDERVPIAVSGAKWLVALLPIASGVGLLVSASKIPDLCEAHNTLQVTFTTIGVFSILPGTSPLLFHRLVVV